MFTKIVKFVPKMYKNIEKAYKKIVYVGYFVEFSENVLYDCVSKCMHSAEFVNFGCTIWPTNNMIVCLTNKVANLTNLLFPSSVYCNCENKC